MSDVKEQLREIAKKQAEEKHRQYVEALDKQLEEDTELVNKVLDLIDKHTIYFKKDSYSNRYTLVTSDLFYEHYMDEPHSNWNKGIHFKESKSWGRAYSYIEVNGYTYYYFEDLLNKYEEDLAECAKQTQSQLEKLREQQDKFKQLKEEEPRVKKMIEEFIAWQNTLEEQDSL